MTNAFKTILNELQTEAAKAPFSKVTSVLGHAGCSTTTVDRIVMKYVPTDGKPEVTQITFWEENDIEIESNKSGVGHRVMLSVSDVQFLLRQSI